MCDSIRASSLTYTDSTRWLLLAMLLMTTACATRPQVPAPEAESAWLEHRATLEALHDWQVRGRVALRTEDEGWSAAFDWQQRGDDYRIRLRGPFGQGAVELRGDRHGVWLKRADQPAVFALNAEALLQQQTGWRLPVTGLAAWLRGLPVGGSDPLVRWDEQGRLLHIAQNGWQIDYQRYTDSNGLPLPQKLRLERDAVQVRFVLDDWQIP
ncbi:MAG: lipoprotein insertase outer membrane protein LolB [Thiogranum sp.]